MTSREELPAGVSPSTLTHFAHLPLARATLQDPAFRIFPSSRTVTDAGRGHTLTGKTWHTPDTIRELLSLYRAGSSPGAPLPQSEDVRGEVRRFYTFGSDLNAHPDLLHGGVIATVLDSSLGNAVGLALPRQAKGMFTVQLNVAYKRPVRTPGSVRVRAWVVRVEGEGRKVWAEGVVEGEVEGDGEVVVHARAEGLWMRGKGKKERGEKGEARL